MLLFCFIHFDLKNNSLLSEDLKPVLLFSLSQSFNECSRYKTVISVNKESVWGAIDAVCWQLNAGPSTWNRFTLGTMAS